VPLVRLGGALVAWKGVVEDDELEGGRAAAAALGGTVEIVPTGIDALGDHLFVLVRKVSTTPDRYPRRPGTPAKRPLG